MLKVIGSWNIEYSAPQWFGVKAFSKIGDDEDNNPQNISFADATAPSSNSAVWSIQQAIDMFNVDESGIESNGGNVFLPEGIYLVTRPIYLRAGVNLTGVQGNLRVHQKGSDSTLDTGTRLYRSKVFVNENSGNGMSAMLCYNINRSNPGEWEWPMARNYNRISDLIFINNYNTHEWSRIPIAIKIGAGALIDNIFFYHIPIAVKSLDNKYLDCKCVKNCTYNRYNLPDGMELPGEDELPYAFDLRGEGDGFVFEHNTISGAEIEYKLGADFNEDENEVGNFNHKIRGSGRYNHALAIRSCGGGFINANIMNADLLVENSKGVTISNNHMEYGPQIRIMQSAAEVSNNCMEKGKRPSIIISDSNYESHSVVRLINNVIYLRGLTDLVVKDNGNNVVLPKFAPYVVARYCPHDVVIPEYAFITIRDMYRYCSNIPGRGYSNPVGINIVLAKVTEIEGQTTTEYNPFEEFNNFSYALSANCKIIAGAYTTSVLRFGRQTCCLI